jgi:DNA-binding protein YbaB
MPDDSRRGFAALGSDPDEAKRRIQDWARGFADKAQRYQAVQEQTERIRLTAASQDGRIKVTVRADGSVTDLELTDKVRTMQPSELAAQILGTMHRAQADIAARVGETMTAHLGDEDQQTRSMVLDNLRERFPEQPADAEPAAEETPSKWDFQEQDEAPTPPAPASDGAPPPSDPPRQPGRPRVDDDIDDGDFGPDFDPLRD